MLDQWLLKSISHYRRSNGVIITPYPTSHKSVGIIGVDREVRVELFDQGSQRRMINKGNQHLRSKFLLISPSSSSNKTFLSPQTFLRRFSFLYASRFFSLRNLSLSKVGEEVEVEVLWALVFLTMMLRSKRTDTKEIEKKTEISRADSKLAQKYIEITILYDA